MGSIALSVTSPSERTRKAGLVPRIKVWLECGGEYVFCGGVCGILRAVERTGSIKQAAADLGKSYRFIWGRLKKAEETLGRTLVEAHVGGKGSQRSFLTPAARRLVADFTAMRKRIDGIAAEFGARFRAHRRDTSPARGRGALANTSS